MFDESMRRRRQLGAHAPAVPSGDHLEAWVERWFLRDSPMWARSTRIQRAGVLDKWVTPYVGGLRLRELGPARVREWRSEIQYAGCTPTQVNAAFSVLSAALSAAVEAGKLPSNPCAGMRRVQVVKTRPRALTPLQVERIRAKMPSFRDAVLVSLMAYAGLRPGEALALTWASVLDHVLVVDRNYVAGEVKLTKTGRRRTVEILEPLRNDLDQLRPHVCDPNAPVIRGRQGNGLLDLRNWRNRVWDAACDTAGVRATPYDCRHTYASLLIHEGRPVVYVAAQMGHASSTLTLDHYAHVYAEADLSSRVSMRVAIAAARRSVPAEFPDANVRRLRETVGAA